MNFIDMRTVVLGLAATDLISALVLGLLYWHNRDRYRGLGLFLLSFLLHSAGMVLMLGRGALPDSLSIVAANVSVMGGLLLLYAGLCRFWGRACALRLPLLMFGIFTAVHAYFTFAAPSLPARALNLNFWMAIFFVLCGWAASAGAPAALRPLARFPSLVLGAFAAVSLFRLGLGLFGQPAHDFFNSGAADTSLVFLFQLLTVLLTFGLFLMVNRRLLADARADFEGRVEAELALHGALKVARLGTWSWDIASNRLGGSKELLEIFGFRDGEFRGGFSEAMSRVVHPDDIALLEAANRSVAESGAPEAVEYRVLRPEGGLRWVHGVAFELARDEQGQPRTLKGYAQDITERKETEARLRDSAAKLELAVTSAGMGLWQWDIKADRRDFDARVCELLGLDKEKFTGSSGEFFAVLHPDDAPAVKAALARAVETDTLYHPEYRVLLPGGGIRHIASRGRLRRDARGEPWMLDGMLWDVTERKTAEAAMQSAQRLESLGSLAGGIAHDFNNILTGITSSLSLLRSKAPGGEAQELVREAETACRAAKGLAGQLLTFASGGRPLRKPLDLGALARQSAEFSLRGSGVAAEFSISGDIYALADRDQVFQAVQSLVLNAAQAMGGSGTVRVSASAAELADGAVPGLPAGKYGAVTVSDSGPGIGPEVVRRLFEPYFSTKGTGRGLGLAVCRSIAVKHGGQITLKTGPGGSAFTLYLPLTQDRPEVSTRRAAAAAAAAGRGRVLVMDDEEIIHRALGRMLRELGYEAEIATDGEMALAAWKSAAEAGRPFAAAIMDLTISGGMGGVEAARRLKALFPAARAIVSSGYAEDPVLAAYKDYGFSGVLPKPFRLEDLSRALEEIAAA